METRVTVSIALYGTLGGVCFFIVYTTGLLPDFEPAAHDFALFNYDPDGWRIKWPWPAFISERYSSFGSYLELIKVWF